MLLPDDVFIRPDPDTDGDALRKLGLFKVSLFDAHHQCEQIDVLDPAFADLIRLVLVEIAVIFGVKCLDDPDLIREVHNVLFCSQEWLKLDAGIISEESALRSVLKRFRTEEDKNLAARCFWDWDKYNMHPAPGMAEIIQELKARGNGVYVLSNASIRLPKVYRRVMPAASV